MEEWRPVVGHSGYEVSSLGRVRSHKQTSPRILKCSVNKNGRPMARLYERGQPTVNIEVHVLVARAFLGPCPEGLEVCHNVADKLDNRLINLRYDTRRNNVLDCIRDGSHSQASKTRCKAGHEFSGNNLTVLKNGKRSCKACSRAATARTRQKTNA